MFRIHRVAACLGIVVFLAVTKIWAVAPVLVKITTVTASASAHDLLKNPQAVAVDLPSGSLFVADRGHHQIVRIDPSGTVTIVAGSGNPGNTDGAGLLAQFKEPQGLAIDSVLQRIYVADTANHIIRRITFDGTVTTFAGSGRGENRDGVGTDASFREPVGLALDSAGNLYVADSGNDKIRVISPSGDVTTFAGVGRPGHGDGSATQALFKGPRGIAVSPQGTVYVADTLNHAIRRIAHGVVSTLAGTTHAGSVDGAPNVAEFNEPSGIALDDAGELWIADTKNHQIRHVGIDGVTTTIAGDGRPGYLDGSDLRRVGFHEPAAVTVAGAIFIADSKNDALRMIVPGLAATDFNPQSGNPIGGDTVRIFGSGFIPGRSEVTFGGVPALSVLFVSSTELVVVTPAHAIGDAEIRITTPAGSAACPMPFRYIPPFVSITVSPIASTIDIGTTQQFVATGVGSDNTTTDLTSRVVWSSANSSIATVDATGLASGIAVGSTTVTATFESLSHAATITVRQPETLPPDPSSVAPPFDPTVVSDISTGVQFLYSGTNPVQKDVAPGAIDARRVAVLRGRVRASDGSPIVGVRVSILDRPDFGFTLTRGDGMYDLAVNGGGDLTLVFEKDGMISAQRRTASPWNNYVVLDDLYMAAYDASATTVELDAPSMQVARGSLVTDADGARQATLLIPAATTATIQTATGPQPMTSLTIRATEYSVGPNGPKLMPATLPAASGYTYCVELSSDESVEAGAISVNFSKPLAFYVDNFLHLPVGTIVPAGYYDRAKGAWIASDNGVVIKVLTTDGGVATIDATGDGIADDIAVLGGSAEELQKLASTYEAGETLWRARITHFTPWDLNFPVVPPAGATPPQQPQPTWFPGVEDPHTKCGSTIDCQNQVFGEAIPIEGTPFSLQYQSDHAPGYRAGYNVEIPISGGVLPASLKRIDVKISIQGRLISQSFPAALNQTYRFTWDGLDAYGRPMQGMQRANIRIGYVYDPVYAIPVEISRTFGTASGIPTATASRGEMVFWQNEETLLGSFDDSSLGLGGWTLSAVKTLEPATGVVHGGAGDQRAGDLQRNVIDRFAGGVDRLGNGDGEPALKAHLATVSRIAVGSDGSVYLFDNYPSAPFFAIRRVAPDGIINTLRTIPSQGLVMVAGPDDALYYTFGQGRQIWRLDLRLGTSALFAGSNTFASLDLDGLPATNTYFGVIKELAFGPDGSLYVLGQDRIRRIGADGIVYGVTGPTAIPRVSDPVGRSARATNPGPIAGFTVGPDGTVYFSALPVTGRAYSIPPDGTIRHFAGTGVRFNYSGDGVAAVAANLTSPNAFAAGLDGSVYIYDNFHAIILRVFTNGIIRRVVGIPDQREGSGDGGPAAAAELSLSVNFAVAPNGAVFVTNSSTNIIRRISPPDSRSAIGEYVVPTRDGGTVDVFSNAGRHLQTINSITGVVILQYGYDASNRLITITDAYGNVTRIERNAAGVAAAIVSPFGKRTTLTMAANGYLESVENSGDERITMTYTAGQMTSMKNARGITKTIVYDNDGRLLREEHADGGSITLTREGSDRNTRITVQSGEGVAAIHNRQLDEASRDTRVDIDPATGLTTTTVRTDDGAGTSTLPDGTVVTSGVRGDPRFGTLAPLSLRSARTPAGRMFSTEMERSVALANGSDPLSLSSITETFKVNGRAWTSTFTKATGIMTTLTPSGRQSTTTLNADGAVASIQIPGLVPANVIYDSHGRLASVMAGSRAFGIFYNVRGEVDHVTDASSRTTSYEYDATGRVTRQILPDTRVIDFTYDANGNLMSVSPPARPAHGFDYTGRDLMERYNPPVSVPGGPTRYAYNRDGKLTLITRPDGSTIQPGYDNAGRLSILATPQGNYGYVYSVATGHLQSVSGPDGGSLSYASDGALLTGVAWAGTVSGSVSYEYDSDFRVSGINGTSYLYDADNLLTAAGALTLARHPQSGLLTGTTLGSVNDHYTYNEFGEVTRYVASAGTTNLLAIDYIRDAVGRITSKTETIGAATGPAGGYEYDRAGRLTRVTRAGIPIAEYDYDANSNRVAHRFVGGSASATYDQQDRLLTYDDTTYTYSANGELVSRTTVGETTTFNYDALGNLRGMQIPGRRIDYVIDAQNRRIGKKIDGTLIQGWLYADQLSIVAEINGTGAVIKRFVYGSRPNVPDFMIADGITYRILSDHLGSPRLVVHTGDGTIAQQIQYDEFGRVLSDTNPGFQPFGFAGGLYDRDTGLVRFGARDYDPHTGRWTAKDPIGFAGGDSNIYSYVGSDPINFIDPTGLDQITADPHVQEMMTSLWRTANGGNDPYEVFAFISKDPDTKAYSCQLLPKSYEQNMFTLKKGTHIPPNTVAVMHTHPRKRTTEPHDPGDVVFANAFDKLIVGFESLYTISWRGVGKFVPGASRGTQEENSLRFPNKATDGCSCKK